MRDVECLRNDTSLKNRKKMTENKGRKGRQREDNNNRVEERRNIEVNCPKTTYWKASKSPWNRESGVREREGRKERNKTLSGFLKQFWSRDRVKMCTIFLERG